MIFLNKTLFWMTCGYNIPDKITAFLLVKSITVIHNNVQRGRNSAWYHEKSESKYCFTKVCLMHQNQTIYNTISNTSAGKIVEKIKKYNYFNPLLLLLMQTNIARTFWNARIYFLKYQLMINISFEILVDLVVNVDKDNDGRISLW